MQTFMIIIFILLVAGMIYFLGKFQSEKTDDKSYLDKMAHFLEGQLSPIVDSENSKRVTFQYRGYECSFEDIVLPGLQNQVSHNIAYLKVKTKSLLSVSFTERSRTQIRSNAQTLEDVTNSRWGHNQGQMELPKSLADFSIYTNHPQRAEKFINNPQILKAFESYKNRDARGHPLISLKVVDGVIVLEFHSPGGLKPSVLEVQHNVTVIEGYLQELISLAEFLQTLVDDHPPQ